MGGRHLCQRAFCPVLQRTLASAPATLESHSSLPFPRCQGSPSIVWWNGLKASRYHSMIIAKIIFFLSRNNQVSFSRIFISFRKIIMKCTFLKRFWQDIALFVYQGPTKSCKLTLNTLLFHVWDQIRTFIINEQHILSCKQMALEQLCTYIIWHREKKHQT